MRSFGLFVQFGSGLLMQNFGMLVQSFGLLMQISLADYILLTYITYKLVAYFDLSLDLFQSVFWISSHYFLTVYHLYIRTISVNIN